jgi:hypothetical protein
MVMEKKIEQGGGVLGLIFLVVAAIKLVQGDGWVVWAILAFLFGGFTTAARIWQGRGRP